MKLPSKQGESKILNRSRPLFVSRSQLLFLACWFLCPLFSSLSITPLLTSDSMSGSLKRVTSPPKPHFPSQLGHRGWPGRRELTWVLWSLQYNFCCFRIRSPPHQPRIFELFLWSGCQVSVPDPDKRQSPGRLRKGLLHLQPRERWWDASASKCLHGK